MPHCSPASQNVLSCTKSLFRATRITTATSLHPASQWLPRSRKMYHRKIPLFHSHYFKYIISPSRQSPHHRCRTCDYPRSLAFRLCSEETISKVSLWWVEIIGREKFSSGFNSLFDENGWWYEFIRGVFGYCKGKKGPTSYGEPFVRYGEEHK